MSNCFGGLTGTGSVLVALASAEIEVISKFTSPRTPSAQTSIRLIDLRDLALGQTD